MILESLFSGLAAVRRNAAAFFDWWRAEMAAVVPSPLKNIFSSQAVFHNVHVSATHAHVTRVTSGAVETLYSIELDAPQSAVDSAVPLPPAHIFLAPGSAFIDRLTLPDAAQYKLRQILSHEIERRSPFRAANVSFDCRIRGRDKNARTIDVEWAILPNDALARAEQLAGTLGFQPISIGLDMPSSHDAAGYVFKRFMPVQTDYALRQPQGVLAGSCLFFLVCSIVAGGSNDTSSAHAVADLKKQAAQALAVKQHGEALLQAVEHVVQRAAAPQFPDALNEVARTLPDTSWISAASMSGNALRLTGFSTAASELIGHLSGPDMFENVRFSSPIVPENSGQEKNPQQRGPRERFEIALTIRGRSAEKEAK